MVPLPVSSPGQSHRDFSQCKALDGGPDDRQTTHLGGEHVNLIGALTNVTKQAFDGVGRSDVAMHRLRKVVKGQRLVFFLGQTAHRLGIELAIFGECSRTAASRLPPCWAGPRCLLVRPLLHDGPAWERH